MIKLQGEIWEPMARRVNLTAAVIRSALLELRQEQQVARICDQYDREEADRDCPRWWHE